MCKIPPSPNGPRSGGGNGLLDANQPFTDTAVPLYATVSDRGLSDSTNSQAPLITEPAGSQERLLERTSNTGGGKWYQGDPSMPPRHNSVSKLGIAYPSTCYCYSHVFMANGNPIHFHSLYMYVSLWHY